MTTIDYEPEEPEEPIDLEGLILKDKVMLKHGVHYVGYWLQEPILKNNSSKEASKI